MSREADALLELTNDFLYPFEVSEALRALPEPAKQMIREVSNNRIQLSRAVKAMVKAGMPDPWDKGMAGTDHIIKAGHAAAFPEEK